ncbi:MAG: phosphoglucosamine mutase [Hydrogeniiclostridium sp.]
MKYFGTDGFRGVANEGLTADHAFKIGKFLGWYFTQGAAKTASCVIGKDTRRSSYMFEYALASGLSSTGVNVYLLHVTTTPSVSYITKYGDFDFGIMITASHNPFYDNGIKVIDRDGYKMSDEILEKIEEYLDGKTEITYARNENIGKITDYIQGRNQYISYLTSATVHSFRGYKVALDCANGAASSIAKTVFEMLGAKTYVIHNEPNGLNINVDCGSTHIESLQKYVAENHLDIGFAFDGDADRCFAVDEKGNVVDGDQIMYICACKMKEEGTLLKDTVVATVMSNYGMEKCLAKEGIQLLRTPVGDKYVSMEIMKNGYSIGGEQSGHIIFSKYSTTGDGILTAIKLMETVVEKKTLLSFLTTPITLYPQLLVNKRVKDADALLEIPEVKAVMKKAEEDMGEKGRLLLRKSGTEPLLRILVEAESEELCRREMDAILACVDSFLPAE